jgi:hypothetical protein
MNCGILALILFLVVKSQLIDDLSPQKFAKDSWNSTVKELNEA